MLLFLAALGVTFFAIGAYRGRQARAIASLPDCPAVDGGDCVAVEAGRIVDRYTVRNHQHVVVVFPAPAAGRPRRRNIQLSDDGWGGRWRGHFPVGETVRVRYHGSTPLAVVELSGHRRLTADNPSSDSSFFRFAGWLFLVAAPFAAAWVVWRYGTS